MKYVYEQKLIFIFNIVAKRCPSAYPYAFMWGQYCCKTSEEEESAISFDECDAGLLSVNSVCCKNSEYQECPFLDGCTNNKGIQLFRIVCIIIK